MAQETFHINEIIEAQGWNDHSLKTLFLQFIEKKELKAELLTFLIKQANDENRKDSFRDINDGDYSHLTTEQIVKIRNLAVEIEMEGDGETRISKEEATRNTTGMEVCDMLFRMGYDEEGRQDRICERLGFNPETGKAE